EPAGARRWHTVSLRHFLSFAGAKNRGGRIQECANKERAIQARDCHANRSGAEIFPCRGISSALPGKARSFALRDLMAREVLHTKRFASDAANFILKNARESFDQRNEFRIALSGGNTPRLVYAEMAKRDLPWEKFLFTFSDERCVPPEYDESNFRMANEALFQPASVPDSSILRMRGEIERVFSGDPALPAARVDQNAKRVTWIIEQKS